jgi:SAM-dependent methyltransferase
VSSDDRSGGNWADWRRRFDVGGYDERWRRMAAAGANPHGEADLVCSFSPRTVLDGGCGTGRVAIELARRGVAVVGVDLDADMLAVARRKAPELTWVLADLAHLDLRHADPGDGARSGGGRGDGARGDGATLAAPGHAAPGHAAAGHAAAGHAAAGHAAGGFDVVMLAGNVARFVAAPDRPAAVAACARLLAPGTGRLISGFQLDVVGPDLADYDRWAGDAGLALEHRFATWDGQPFVAGGGYAVSVHRAPGAAPDRS